MSRGTSGFLVVVLAVGTSIVTVLLTENLRDSKRHKASVPAEQTSSELRTEPAPLEVPLVRPPSSLQADPRLVELTRRMADLEARLDAMGKRQPLPLSNPQPGTPGWRDEVLAILDEALARREGEAQEEAVKAAEAARERDILLQVSVMRDEFDLGPGEEALLIELMREVSRRMQALEKRMQAPDADPDELSRRMSEFEAWHQSEAIRLLGPARAEELFGL